MVTAHSSKETDEVPTPEALIEMLRKQAFDLGEIGLTSTLKPQDTLQSIRTDDVRSGDSNRYAFSVASAMREGEQEQAHCRHVQNVIENTLGHHSSVYRKADAIVNRRLLAAGTDPKLVDLWSNIRGILRPKVVKLYRLENPLPELPKRVKVTLLRQCEKRTDRKDVYLSVADTLDGIHAALRSVSATIDGTGQLITSRGQGPWMYQFIDRHSILSSERRTLETDADYQYLMSEMTKPESTRTSACIFQESTLTFQQDLEATRKEEELKDVLDEDGRPFFKAVDWESLIRKEFGRSGGEGKARVQEQGQTVH